MSPSRTKTLEKHFRFDSKESILALKKGIRAKFGTLARFCRCAHYDAYHLNKLLRLADSPERNKELSSVRVLMEITEPVDTPGVEITDRERAALRDAIYKQYKSVREFTETRPWFREVWVSAVLNGKAKRRTAKVVTLAQSLFVSLDEINK